MALEEDLLTPEAWVNFPHAWTHETLFFFASCYLHPTAVGLNHQAQQGESLFTFTAKGSLELESLFALSTAALGWSMVKNKAGFAAYEAGMSAARRNTSSPTPARR
jgi:hypothetical protein